MVKVKVTRKLVNSWLMTLKVILLARRERPGILLTLSTWRWFLLVKNSPLRTRLIVRLVLLRLKIVTTVPRPLIRLVLYRTVPF